VTEYGTIVADPPWRYDNAGTRNAAAKVYDTMSIADLCEPKFVDQINQWSGPNTHLYLWTTNNFLKESFEVLEAWGFAYKTMLTWIKPQLGLGNWFRSSTEHVLFGARGKLRTTDRQARNHFTANRGRHSAKPDCFYDLVERTSPGPYLEMFSRRRRLGWEFWGDES